MRESLLMGWRLDSWSVAHRQQMIDHRRSIYGMQGICEMINIPVDIKIASGYKIGDEIGDCILYVNSVDPRVAIKLSGGLWISSCVGPVFFRMIRGFFSPFPFLIKSVVVE